MAVLAAENATCRYLENFTTELFHKNGHDFNACSSVRDIVCNTDVITSIVLN